MLDFRVPESFCPACKHALDACLAPQGYSPKEGDISVCIQCSEMLVFNENLSVHSLGDGVFDLILKEPQIYAQLMKMKQMVLENLKEKKPHEPTS